MEFTVIGIEKVDYDNKQGRHVSGFRVHMTFEKKNCDGLAVETVFLNDEMGGALSVGNTIELYYNKFGRPASISVIA